VSRRRYGAGLPPGEQLVALDHRHRSLRKAAEAVCDAFVDVSNARYNNEARRAAARVEVAIGDLAIELGRNVDRSAVREAHGA
jgi:hypothetical protein